MLSPSFFSLALLCTGLAPYDIVDLDASGGITGSLKYSGAALTTQAATSAEPPCTLAEPVPDSQRRDAVPDALVWLANVPRGVAPAANEQILRIKGCRFQPTTVAVMLGQRVVFLNTDPTAHTVVGHIDEEILFRLDLSIQGQEAPKRMWRLGRIDLSSGARDGQLRGSVLVSQNPYFTVSDAHGSFELDRIPEGSYRLHVWHKQLGEIQQEVDIKADHVQHLDISLDR